MATRKPGKLSVLLQRLGTFGSTPTAAGRKRIARQQNVACEALETRQLLAADLSVAFNAGSYGLIDVGQDSCSGAFDNPEVGVSSLVEVHGRQLNLDEDFYPAYDADPAFGGFVDVLKDNNNFGKAVANLGDLDGDGVTDVAVGAHLDDDGGTNHGAVFVLFMNADGTVKSHQKISDVEGGFNVTLDDNDAFGTSLAALGDLDGDGVTELAVGATGDDDGGSSRGAVYVLFLNSDGTVKANQKISAVEGNLTAALNDGDGFGSSLALLGDINDDGVADLGVGAVGDDDGGPSRGAVYVVLMNANGTVASHQKISNTEGGFTGALDDSDYFGKSLAVLGDLDHDGITELVVGSYSDDDGGNGRGAVYVLFMNSNGTVKSHQKISNTEGGFEGALADTDYFGFSLTGLGDFDSDGVNDLAVGAVGDDSGGNSSGAVYILYLNSNGTVKSHQKISATEGNLSASLENSQFSAALANLGDMDGDGINDLAVGAPLDGDTNRGAMFVLFLNTNGTVKSFAKVSDDEPAPFSLSETFQLNSLPTATKTIYLDFNGHTTTGTNWNAAYTGGTSIVTPAYDTDGDATTFSDIELTRIQRIWQRVSEDYAPFNVNVTTADPGAAALTKSGGSDTQWGIRVVIGGTSDWYGSSVGGVAYYNSFVYSSDTPAFVFNTGEVSAAEAISHEVGHSLGLHHDGRIDPAVEYHSGSNGWAPIMGVSYYQNVTQWSKGEYTDANNTEDDLAMITGNNGFTYRVDDHGDSAGSATTLVTTTSSVSAAGIIEKNTDFDWFSFTTGGGDLDIDIAPAARGGNLNILATLYDASNTIIAISNPLSIVSGVTNAFFQVSVAAGSYYISVTGTGQGDPLAGGYSDYGSLGQYFISGTIPAFTGSTVSVSATDASKSEGNSDSKAFTFTVTRSGNVSGQSSVDYVVAGSGTNPANASDFVGGVLPSGTIVFNANETQKLVTVNVNGDGTIEPDENFSLSLINPGVQTIIAGTSASGSILNDDGPQLLFSDSFEVGEWNGLWVEDSQNDWFRSTQRATAGGYAAEVDGSANNATLTTATVIDLSGMQSATLTFDWLIESGFDAGEYLSLDISTNGGSTWTSDVRRLNGNVSQENVWYNETVDLTPYKSANVKIRFRSKVSASDEDANVDNVKIVGIADGPNTNPVANAAGPYVMNEGGSVILNGSVSIDSDGTIASYAWDLDGDGQYDDATGVTASFTTTNSGTHIVGLQVTDNRGATDTTTATVTVNNVAPTANAGGDQNGFAGTAVNLTAGASSDPGNDIVSYAWDLDGDGQYDDATGVNASLTAASPGTYVVGVQVTDADGAVSTDSVTITITDAPSEVVLFEDSFEVSEWNGQWVEDSQNDWFRSTQRATDGTHAAEVDGSANNATLTLASAVDLTGFASATLTFDWLIESGFDAGEYLSLDISTNGGSTWQTDVRRLSGDVSQEDVWHSETIDLTAYATSSVRIRFRSKVSSSTEDANVDNVRIVGSAATSGAGSFGSFSAAQSTSRNLQLLYSTDGPSVTSAPSAESTLNSVVAGRSSAATSSRSPVSATPLAPSAVDSVFANFGSLLDDNLSGDLLSWR
ncbi:MAG: PKD domain-containing protein [Planctomycetaceae bacterium]